jgi:hypothetical protein
LASCETLELVCCKEISIHRYLPFQSQEAKVASCTYVLNGSSTWQNPSYRYATSAFF